MKVKCLHNGKIYQIKKEEDHFYIVEGSTLFIPIKLHKDNCLIVDEETELTRII